MRCAPSFPVFSENHYDLGQRQSSLQLETKPSCYIIGRRSRLGKGRREAAGKGLDLVSLGPYFSMNLLVLGSTGYHPNNRRQTAAFLLPELGVVFDAGSGLFRVREFLQAPSLDIFLSHAHLDHVFGLTFMFDILHGKSLEHVRVHGQREKLEAIQQHLFAEPLFPVKPPFDYAPLAGPLKLRDGAVLKSFPLDHPGGSLGFRIDWPDRSLAYITDTTARPHAPYLPFIQGVDVLIHECYFADGQEELAAHTGHSCLTPVLELSQAAEVGFLVLTHMNPLEEGDDPVGFEKHRERFPDVILAEDLMEIEF